MKLLYFSIAFISFCLFSSFTPREDCNYAGSNMNFVAKQTKKALSEANINVAKFRTYKAIKAIQTSTRQFNACGCKDAEENINETLNMLKDAVHSNTLTEAKSFLEAALAQTTEAIYDLERHQEHNTDDVIELDPATAILKALKTLDEKHQKKQVDSALSHYQKSLNTIIDSVNCIDALAYANKIFLECEQQLLKSNLSEIKKYYNYKTKEIMTEALDRIGSCEKPSKK